MGLDIFDSFATDEKLEVEGKEHDIGGGTTILVGRNNNINYLLEFNRLYDENATIIEAGQKAKEGSEERKAADDAALQVIVKTLAKTVLLGWKNLKFKGKEMKYSQENAETLLMIKDFRTLVIELASNVDHYRMKREQEQQKN